MQHALANVAPSCGEFVSVNVQIGTTFANGAIRFVYTNPATLKRSPFRFIRGAQMEVPLAAHFAECGAPQS
jgi:hypothetical protein